MGDVSCDEQVKEPLSDDSAISVGNKISGGRNESIISTSGKWPSAFSDSMSSNHPTLLSTCGARLRRLKSLSADLFGSGNKPSSWVLFYRKTDTTKKKDISSNDDDNKEQDVETDRLHWRFNNHMLNMYDSEDATATPVVTISIDKVIAVDLVKQLSPPLLPPTWDDSTTVEELANMTRNQVELPTYPLLFGGRLEHIFAVRTTLGNYFCGTSPSADAWEKAACFEFACAMRKHVGHACSVLCSCGCHQNPHYIREFYDMHEADLIGTGEFGRVCTAINKKNGRPVVVKIINTLKNEVKSHARTPKGVDYPSVVQLLDFYFTPDHVYCVMEKLHRNLLEVLLDTAETCFDERQSKFIVQQILSGLGYLHSISIVHGDLKLENLLVVDEHPFPQLKVSDFGYLRIIKERCFQKAVILGSREYIPPEGFTTEPRFDKAFDMWSVGVITYVLLSGAFPYNARDNIAQQIREHSILFPIEYWGKISEEAISFIKHLLNEAVWFRLRTCHQALKHSWISQDYFSWCDMRMLEARVGESGTIMRYGTLEEDDLRFEQLRQIQNLPSWEEIGCKL